MIIMYNENGKTVDARHTVAIYNSISFADAVQITENGKYERVTYMTDDQRTFNNDAIIDATEEEKEQYRKYQRQFREGDKVIIARGRKMKGEVKIVSKMFTYRPYGTYGHQDVDYLVFTDNTKVNRMHCDFI